MFFYNFDCVFSFGEWVNKLCDAFLVVTQRQAANLEKVDNGRVIDKLRRLPRHQRAQAHNSTLYRRQLSFMYWLCRKQNYLLCAYECDFGDNDKITIV
jgi:hypothetical protein